MMDVHSLFEYENILCVSVYIQSLGGVKKSFMQGRLEPYCAFLTHSLSALLPLTIQFLLQGNFYAAIQNKSR